MPTYQKLLPSLLLSAGSLYVGSVSESLAASTDEAAFLETVEVRSAAGSPSLQALPASATVIEGAQARDRQLQVNLSEGMNGVAGLQIKNRQNYAQDLQLSIRGYGARSTFGLRGIRMYVDGIPATMPDGQGSLSHVDIASMERVEVLRGPYSALYGNSAGGVISVFTETPEGRPFIESGMSFGSSNQKRFSSKAGGQTAEGLSYLISVNRFITDGYRDHSAAERNVFNAKLSTKLGNDARLTVTANSMRSDAQDPQGLTWEDWKRNPRSVSANTLLYDARKFLEQTQIGGTYERQIDGTNSLALTAYAGHRSMNQYQSIPKTTQQNNPGHAGGVIDLSRDYAGLDARWTGKYRLTQIPVTLTAGLAVDFVQENRQGYENFVGNQLGVKGALRRDEKNTITNADPYIQANWQLAPSWSLDTGLRYSRVNFKIDDHYINGAANPDDSGSTAHRQLLPIVALSHQLSTNDTIYASAGRGFETPTLAEMSYSNTGSGMNRSLKPSVSTQYELGFRQRLTGDIRGSWSAAVFHATTNDEIVSDTSSGGRTTFRNAGKTRRYGAELQLDIKLSRQWDVQSAYTYLNAQFLDAQNAGKTLPGLARQNAWIGVNYRPTAEWRFGISAQHAGKVYVNDQNEGAAPSFTTASASVGYSRNIGEWVLSAFARVDNLFDRQYVGSVIVNDSNGRYYEGAPGRNWSTGINLGRRF